MDAYAISTGAFALTTVAASWKWFVARYEVQTITYTVEALHTEIAGLKADKTRLYTLFDEVDATHALDLMAADNRAKKQDDLIRKQGIEIAEFRAKEHKRLAPLKAQAAKNHADKLAREAAQKALHASMQADIDATREILDRKDIAA